MIILDGELVAVDAKGNAVFYELPSELKARVKAKLVYYVFDLPYLDGLDLRGAELSTASACWRRCSTTPRVCSS